MARDSWPAAGTLVRCIAHDVRTSWRSLRATPGFTVVALVILTLGIGASTAIFSVVDAVVLRGCRSTRAIASWLSAAMSRDRSGRASSTAPTFLDWRDQQNVFEAHRGASGGRFTVRDGGEPETLAARRVTPRSVRAAARGPAMGARSRRRRGRRPGSRRDHQRRLLAPAIRRRSRCDRPDDDVRERHVGDRRRDAAGFDYPVGLGEPADCGCRWGPPRRSARGARRTTS